MATNQFRFIKIGTLSFVRYFYALIKLIKSKKKPIINNLSTDYPELSSYSHPLGNF